MCLSLIRRFLAKNNKYTFVCPQITVGQNRIRCNGYGFDLAFYPLKPARRATSSSGGGVMPSIGKCFAQPVDEWKIENGKLSFKQPLRKKGGVNAIGLLLPLQIGKEGGGKYNQFVVTTPSLEVRCKR